MKLLCNGNSKMNLINLIHFFLNWPKLTLKKIDLKGSNIKSCKKFRKINIIKMKFGFVLTVRRVLTSHFLHSVITKTETLDFDVDIAHIQTYLDYHVIGRVHSQNNENFHILNLYYSYS